LATSGRSVSAKKLSAIKAAFELGLESKTSIAASHHINRATLHKMARREGWEYGRSNKKATDLITKKVTAKIVANETQKLITYTEEYLFDLGKNRQLHRVVSDNMIDEISKANGQLSKTDGDKFRSIFQAVEISTKILDLMYRGKRLAMGLKSEDAITVNTFDPEQILRERGIPLPTIGIEDIEEEDL
jgi:hypothetical protein